MTSHHIRYSPKWHVPHHINTRTLVTLCGVSAIDWSLHTDKPANHCLKCKQALNSTRIANDSETPTPVVEGSASDPVRSTIAPEPQSTGNADTGPQPGKPDTHNGTPTAPTAPAPWSQRDSLAVVKDTYGNTVSFAENAPRIIHAVNFEAASVRMLQRLINAISDATSPLASPRTTIHLVSEMMVAVEFLKVRR